MSESDRLNQAVPLGGGILDLLDRPDELPRLVEERLLSPDLPAFVSELEAVRGKSSATAELPGALVARIVVSGLSALSEEEFLLVMKQPRSLLALQRAVLVDGGDYWDRVVRRTSDGQELSPAPRQAATRLVPPRRGWTWPVAGWAAAAAILIAVTASLVRMNALERQLAEQAARYAAYQREHPPVTRDDLPGGGEPVPSADPADTPEGDPHDLPA